MSLNPAQRKQTSKELIANYEISGLTPEDIQADLGFTVKQLEDTLNLGPASHGESVWRLRDYLEAEIKEQGKVPYPYSILKKNIWYKYK
ncbi:DUF2316 family protein [Niallia taxi]|uniref:DUF2316 family protein n=1 Tax=Niallia taxi TaxID=2499688 RepID=A0A437K467_9BACI|nr:DUF2316 family protein [Niallia taxi]RVT57229.1 DUF2316 family protein [Niallia taxi]